MKTIDSTQSIESVLQQKEEELALARQALAQFTRGISHELESPINTLNNLLKLLEEEHGQHLDEDGTELLTMILTSARRSVTMVEGIGRYARRCRLSGTPESINTGDAVDTVLGKLAFDIAQTKATIEVGEMPVVTGFRAALEHVLFELISNSIRFTVEDNSHAKVSISGHRLSRGVEIIVCDEGPGISEKSRHAIFGVFHRLNSPQKHESAGLGLPICLQLINAMQGRIWLDPDRLMGSAMHIYLPDSET